MNKKIVFSLVIGFTLAGCGRLPLLDTIINPAAKADGNGSYLADDFSDEDSGWDTFTHTEGSAYYEDNAFLITVQAPNADLFSIFPRIFINSEIHVRASRVDGSENNNYGIVCRYQDPENFYAGQISSDGYAGIFMMEDGTYKLLGRKFMVRSDSVLGGSGENLIQFVCDEDQLVLSVNGEAVDRHEDDTFRSGETGVIAGTVDGDFGKFRFDDYSVVTR